MSHTVNHTLLLTLGQVVGWLGISIAIYLQWVAKEECEPLYFWGFLLFGMAFVIAHIGILNLSFLTPWAALGYLAIIGIQLYAGRWVYKRAGVSGLTESLDYAIKS